MGCKSADIATASTHTGYRAENTRSITWYLSFLSETILKVVIGGILPVVGTLGLIGNAISAFIYSRRSMRSSMNLYLAALAFSDITIIVTAFFLFSVESMRRRSFLFANIFAILSPVAFPLGLAAQTLSVYFTIAAALDCFVHVFASDVIKQRFCTIRTAKWVRPGYPFPDGVFR